MTSSPISTLIEFIFPGISNASLDWSDGMSFPGNSLVTAYSSSILTSRTSKASRFDRNALPNKRAMTVLFIFVMFIYLYLTLVCNQLNVCGVYIIT